MLRLSTGMALALCGAGWASLASAQSSQGLVINDVTVTEGASGLTTATFTIAFADSSAPHGAAIVSYTTTAGTATSGGQCGGLVDFLGVSGLSSVSIAASEHSKQFTIQICGDTRDEPDQTFFINITARGGGVKDGQGLVTIVDDDPAPAISVSDGRVNEGAAGASTNGAFTITIAGASENTVSVQYATINRSATGGRCGVAGADFERAAGTFTPTHASVQPPQNTQTIVLMPICGDSVSEGDQQFEVQLSNATNATIADASGIITIVDDDPLPSLSITSQVLVNEPTALAQQAQAVFTVTLAGPPTEQPVSVQFATVPGTASGGSACTANTADYITQSGTLTFSVAKGTQQIQVPICADSIPNEQNESFTVTLVRAANAAIAQGAGRATIH